jgi:hypothetical protein
VFLTTSGCGRLDIDPPAGTIEAHLPIHQGKNGVVPAEPNILPRQKLCSPLADNDIAGYYHLAAEFFYPEPFANAIAPVLDAALSFFMGHLKKKI